jgi:hypothetical protein
MHAEKRREGEKYVFVTLSSSHCLDAMHDEKRREGEKYDLVSLSGTKKR